MKAWRLLEFGQAPRLVDLPVPEPVGEQVLLKVTAAGVCHTDLHLVGATDHAPAWRAPFVLGHECAGEIVALGPDASGWRVGDAVVVYGGGGCGRCRTCLRGVETYCRQRDLPGPAASPGLGVDGAMAEYMLVPHARHLVSAHGLDPLCAAPLTDAGMTAHRAVRRSVDKLVPGSVCVVIGAGGLGQMAIQILRALTPAEVVVLDVAEDKLTLARDLGAHHALRSDEDPLPALRDITGRAGAAAVLDFVGAQATLDIAAGIVGYEADLSIVGFGGGVLPVRFGGMPFEVSTAVIYGGGQLDLIDVVALARRGLVTPIVEAFALDEAPEVMDRLAHGKIAGRAVLVPSH